MDEGASLYDLGTIPSEGGSNAGLNEEKVTVINLKNNTGEPTSSEDRWPGPKLHYAKNTTLTEKRDSAMAIVEETQQHLPPDSSSLSNCNKSKSQGQGGQSIIDYDSQTAKSNSVSGTNKKQLK